ncbi:hypothetical protein OS493_010778 [Desmophyllum pertusum]|uniref:Uncharacterized protein n=1 Tax=Desmophyllum pertusum TaxID=174260 RepID=A0A9X0CYC4_9CNID|nr:hypothetical protein OS493_010778 [Desmophyllum pertusum]
MLTSVAHNVHFSNGNLSGSQCILNVSNVGNLKNNQCQTWRAKLRSLSDLQGQQSYTIQRQYCELELNKIRRSHNIREKTKIEIGYSSNVLSTLLNGAEIWRVTRETVRYYSRLQYLYTKRLFMKVSAGSLASMERSAGSTGLNGKIWQDPLASMERSAGSTGLKIFINKALYLKTTSYRGMSFDV